MLSCAVEALILEVASLETGLRESAHGHAQNELPVSTAQHDLLGDLNNFVVIKPLARHRIVQLSALRATEPSLTRRIGSNSVVISQSITALEFNITAFRIVHPSRELAHEVRGIALDSEVVDACHLARFDALNDDLPTARAIKCGFDNVASLKRCCLDPASRQLAVPPKPERVIFRDRKNISENRFIPPRHRQRKL